MNMIWLLFSFKGRIGRVAYWLGSAVVLVGWFAVVLATIALARNTTPADGIGRELLIAAVPLDLFAGLLLIVVNFALSAKRFHDRNRSLWRFLIALVPFVGPTWLLIELGCLPGTPGANRFGSPPEPLVRDWPDGSRRAGQPRRQPPGPPPSPPVIERLTGPQRTPPVRSFGRRGLP